MSKAFPIAIVVSTLFLFTYFVLATNGIILSFEPGLSAGDISRWCERVSNGIFREPANALSNLGFMVAGLCMFKVLSIDSATSHKNNTFMGLNRVSILYAGAAVYLGPGSMLMHGTHTEWGQWADNLSMVMYIIFPWLYNLKEMGRWSQERFLLTYAAIVTFYGYARWFYGDDLGIGLDLFGLSIGLWIISEALFRLWSPSFRWASGFVGFGVAAIFGISPNEILSNTSEYWWVVLFWLPAAFAKSPPRTKRTYNPWFYLGVVSYTVAFTIWLNQWSDLLCDPDSWIQPHAIWHLLSAVSTWCFFKFFRTEKELKVE